MFPHFCGVQLKKTVKMSRICALPLTLRQYTVKNLRINSFNRHLSYSSRLLSQNLTSNPSNEFHNRESNGIISLINQRKFNPPTINTNFSWRNYSTQKPPPNSNDKPASSGGDDDHLYEDDNIEVFSEDDEEGEYL